MQKLSPRGMRITGALERVYGIACITGFDEHGNIEYEGYTEIDWDTQEAVRRNNQRVFVDDDGQEWLENQLVDAPDDDEEGE